MSDSYADTIRRALSGSPYGHEPRPDALAALDALLAEMDEVLKDRARLADVVRANSKERTELKAERQQAQQEYGVLLDERDALGAALQKVVAERQQAIDALRAILDVPFSVERAAFADAAYIAREALANLGEQPK